MPVMPVPSPIKLWDDARSSAPLTSSVAVAGRRRDGLNHGELTDPPQPGTGGLIGRLEDLWAAHDPCVLTVNGTPGAQTALLKELNEHGWMIAAPGKPVPPGKRRLQVTGSQEFAQACGALVQDVNDDSPAARAGLKPYDVILTVDGREIYVATGMRVGLFQSIEGF